MTRKLLLAAVVLSLGGCNWWYNTVPSPDDLMHNIPWFDHMIRSRAIHPYESAMVPRNTPPGTVPIGGGERHWGTGNPAGGIPTYGFDTVVANALQHPVAAPKPGVRSGAELYDTYCAVCHGYQGAGDGTVRAGGFSPPSLLTASARGWSDGYLYSMVRYGRGLMPQYGDKITRIDERWAVVEYLRSLQARAPAPTPAAGAH